MSGNVVVLQLSRMDYSLELSLNSNMQETPVPILVQIFSEYHCSRLSNMFNISAALLNFSSNNYTNSNGPVPLGDRGKCKLQ